MESSSQRLHAYLAHLGLASRREIERWITAGHVFVNSKPAKLGQKIDPAKDQIRVKGKNLPFSIKTKPVCVLLYKPRGVVTTLKDPEGRVTVDTLLPRRLGRLYPVGRLDIMSEGLLLMTNDGELAQRLIHPRYEIPKTYEVKIRGDLTDSKIAHLEKGIRIESEKYKPAEILKVREVTQSGVKKFAVTIRVFEGKNHHVRNMFEAINCRVIKLKRIAMGPLTIKGLPRGGHRILTTGQLNRLRKEVGLE